MNVACFCFWFGSPQLTLALCSAAWSHSRFVPQCAGDENGCPLRNSRNFFHLALPASVGVHGSEGSTVYKNAFIATFHLITVKLLHNVYRYCLFKLVKIKKTDLCTVLNI